MRFNIKQPGSLLLELLIVIGVVAIIVPIVSQIVVSSLNSNKWSAENKVAVGLVDEMDKAVESISFEKWQNIYSQVKGDANRYYAIKVNGAWTVVPDSELVTSNNVVYTRYFTIYNVCRDNTTKSIVTTVGVPPCTTGNSDDPSTQKISVTVVWKGGTLTKDYYLTRWRNQICDQTSWSGTGSGPANCPSTLYESQTNIDVNSTPGSLQLQSN